MVPQALGCPRCLHGLRDYCSSPSDTLPSPRPLHGSATPKLHPEMCYWHAQNTPTMLFLLPHTALSLSLLLTFSGSSPDAGGGPHATRPTLTRTAHEWGTRMACSGPTPCGPCGMQLCCSGACESLRMCVHLVPLLTSLT